MSKLPLTYVDTQTGFGYKGTYEDGGNKVILYMPKVPSREIFFRILSEVKGLEGAQWLNGIENKPWACKHPKLSRRNKNNLGMLTNGTFPETQKNPFEHFYKNSSIITPALMDTLKSIMSEYPLKNHQIEDIPILAKRRTVELAWEMGLGKTLCCLIIMRWLKTVISNDGSVVSGASDANNFWVIGPKSALKAWETQIVDWNCQVSPKLISNSHQAIKQAMDEAPFPPIMLVNDESANLKNAQTQRVQLILELSNLMSNYWDNTHYIINMSGTPEPNDPADWWSQIEILSPGFIRERSAVELRKRCAYMSEGLQGKYGTYKKVLGWNTAEITSLGRRISPIVKVRFKKDCVDLPDKIFIKHKLKPIADTLSAAKLIVNNSESAIVALSKLRQLSDGFQYEDTGATEFYSPKDDAIIQYLEELETNNETRIVIWAAYRQAIDKIVEIVTHKGWGAIKVDGRGWKGYTDHEHKEWEDAPDTDENQFQKKQLDKKLAFVANPETGGEGLTLTRAKTAINYSNTFRADKRRQSIDRIHRIGMDANIRPRIIDLIHLPSDEQVLDKLERKINLERLSLGEVISEYDRYSLETI